MAWYQALERWGSADWEGEPGGEGERQRNVSAETKRRQRMVGRREDWMDQHLVERKEGPNRLTGRGGCAWRASKATSRRVGSVSSSASQRGPLFPFLAQSIKFISNGNKNKKFSTSVQKQSTPRGILRLCSPRAQYVSLVTVLAPLCALSCKSTLQVPVAAR